jgi:hypothetical protein
MQKLTVNQAAQQLGVSPQAVHGRINRGSLEHIREHGRIYVYVPDTEAQGEQYDEIEPENENNPYITSLISQIESLKQDKEDWKLEARRKDHMVAKLMEMLSSMEEERLALQPAPRESWFSRWFG